MNKQVHLRGVIFVVGVAEQQNANQRCCLLNYAYNWEFKYITRVLVPGMICTTTGGVGFLHTWRQYLLIVIFFYFLEIKGFTAVLSFAFFLSFFYMSYTERCVCVCVCLCCTDGFWSFHILYSVLRSSDFFCFHFFLLVRSGAVRGSSAQKTRIFFVVLVCIRPFPTAVQRMIVGSRARTISFVYSVVGRNTSGT